MPPDPFEDSAATAAAMPLTTFATVVLIIIGLVGILLFLWFASTPLLRSTRIEPHIDTM